MITLPQWYGRHGSGGYLLIKRRRGGQPGNKNAVVKNQSLACHICGESFIQTGWRSRAVTCSKVCSLLKHNKYVGRHPVTCAVCGIVFQGQAHRVVCSGLCRREHVYERTHVTRQLKDCAFCGKAFMGTKCHRYCSMSCCRLRESEKRYARHMQNPERKRARDISRSLTEQAAIQSFREMGFIAVSKNRRTIYQALKAEFPDFKTWSATHVTT